ncbi:hypothetical protein PSHT_08597 [Puccinia striiformis]|uniref:CxC6 like cysteine cluster associated with KDZ domain-containing protein n=1 Tax=Puccinia striiformis TaxID=27350 RepID=A0A2S4VNG6_9BASI|nr:hypothetical protein PSHT_08597 [Puccinia striiformis]
MVNLYNSTFMGDHAPPLYTPQQSFWPQMSVEVCKDGMDIDTLVFNYASRGKSSMVPSSGLTRVRYNEAKKQCSSWIAAEGTAHKNHSCGLCTSITHSEANNNHSVVRAVVTDGLTIGHWRCSASAAQLEKLAKESGHPAPDGPCRRTLDTVRHRYCSFHQPFLEGICQAQPCIQPALPNKKTCGLQSHLDAAKTFDARQADESDRAEESRRAGEEGASKKPTLSRARTHNDQLAVAPCGVILARQTMFNSESPSAVKVNCACKLLAHIYKSTAEERNRFIKSIVAVDVFHFKSHKEDDCFCRQWTDPNLYPQLKKDGSWIQLISSRNCKHMVWRFCLNLSQHDCGSIQFLPG